MEAIEYEIQISMNTEEFISHVMETRKANKGQWYAVGVVVNGKQVTLKAFDTGIQRITVNQFQASGPLDCKVKDFKAFLVTQVS